MIRLGTRYGRGEHAHVDNFWDRVDRTGECYMWIGTKDHQGYGHLQFGRRTLLAHRVSFAWRHNKNPLDLDPQVLTLHHCDTPSCVNPDHLFWGTKADNAADAKAKGRLPRGEAKSQSKLTREQVWAIHAHDLVCKVTDAKRKTNVAWAKQLGVSDKAISKIRKAQLWEHMHPDNAPELYEDWDKIQQTLWREEW